MSPKKASGTLAVKRTQRAKRPRFIRHADHRKPSLAANWRKPRGLHNKQRDNKTGSSPRVSDGWRTPVDVRGKHISGRTIVRVATLAELNGLDAATTGVVIASVGAKRQIELLTACKQKGLHVLNHKADERIATLTGKRAAAKAAVEEARKEKEAKVKKVEATKKKSVEEKLSDDERKEQENKLKEEVLTSKGQ